MNTQYPKKMKVDWPTCGERRRLSGEVTEAVKGVLIAKANLDAAMKAMLDSTNIQRTNDGAKRGMQSR